MSSYNLKTQLSWPDFKSPPINSPDLTPTNLIDFHLQNNPNYPFGILSNPINLSEKDLITWNEVGSAIIKVVEDLNGFTRTDTNKEEGNVVGIIASSDPLVYFTMLLAIMRSGCVPFAISPRNSATAILHLIKSTNCKALYVQFDPNTSITDLKTISMTENLSRNQIQEVLQQLPRSYPLEFYEFPTAFDLFPRLASTKAYYKPDPSLLIKLRSCSPNFITSDSSALMILHSSGTTAFPKPIYLTKPSFQSWITASQFTNFDWKGEILASMVLPAFHAMGIHFGLITGLADGAISGFFRPLLTEHGDHVVQVPNCLNVMEAMKALGCTVAAFSPMMLAEFAADEYSVEFLKTLKRVGFGGGPLTVEIGNKLYNEGVQLSAMYGSTEVGIIATLFPEHTFGKNWEYFEISNQLTTRLVPHEDLYELVILSSDLHRCSLDHIDHRLSDQVYHTNDLLAKHPFLELYRIVGRMDDQIMLSNSEKTNPGPLEAILAFHPAIQGSLLFGRGKPQNGVIIEPEDGFLVDTKNRTEVNTYIDLIWPSIEEVNRFAPTHSRLTRDLIIITDPRIIRLPKTTKGQVSRVKTLEIFSEEIEMIYHSRNLSSLQIDDDDEKILVDKNGVLRFDYVLESVRGILREVLGWEVKDHKDLFLQGCDSLSAIQIRLRINQLFLSQSKKDILVPQNIVYRYASVSGLSQWIFQCLSDSKLHQKSVVEPHDCTPLISLILKYSPSKPNSIV